MHMEMQKLHDAVKALGDAALDIATLISSLSQEGEKTSSDRPQWPNTGKPLTAERFQKMIEAPDKPEVPIARSYVSGRVFVGERIHKRHKAKERAARVGYGFERWCKTVRRVRGELKLNKAQFGAVLGVTSSAVQNWEVGVCFAKRTTRDRLERLAHSLCSVEPAHWRGEG